MNERTKASIEEERKRLRRKSRNWRDRGEEGGREGRKREREGVSEGFSGGPYYSSFSSGVLCPFGEAREIGLALDLRQR